jgi:uncharacterized protein YbjT (DUF2867 family)
MTMSRKVLITGATGDTGRASVREAIALGLGNTILPPHMAGSDIVRPRSPSADQLNAK